MLALGAQFSFGGHKQSFGGHAPECPLWRRAWTKNTGASVLQKKGLQKVFQAIFKKRRLKIIFSDDLQNFNNPKDISSRGQGNFRGREGSWPRTSPLKPRPRTSKRVLEDVLEAKDVLKNSTSAIYLQTLYQFTLIISIQQTRFE